MNWKLVNEQGEEVANYVDQLQAKVAELEEENARWKNSFERTAENTKLLLEQLAAEQLNNKLLREALTTCVCAMQDYQAGIGITEMFDKCERLGRKALYPLSDTSALDAYVAEKVKGAMK